MSKTSKTTKTATSVEDLIRQTAGDEIADDFAEESKEREIIRHLYSVRTLLGFSQKDIANKLGCTQSKVSKLESGIDADVRLGDLDDYLKALGYDLSLFVRPKEFGTFEQIKFCAMRIRDCLNSLVELAGNDEEIQKGVSKAHLEVLVNLVKIVVESAQDLPTVEGTIPGVIDPTEFSSRDREALAH